MKTVAESALSTGTPQVPPRSGTCGTLDSWDSQTGNRETSGSSHPHLRQRLKTEERRRVVHLRGDQGLKGVATGLAKGRATGQQIRRLVHLEMSPPPETILDSDERTELDALRLENDTLRRHLGRLEDKVQRAEESANLPACQVQQMAQQLHHGTTEETDVHQQQQQRLAESAAPLEVRHLHGILQWLHQAKADMAENDRSKVQLEGDVRLLYNLLEKAKRERKSHDGKVQRLEKSIATSNARAVELDKELQLQQRSLTRVLKSDRDVYEARTEAAEANAERRGQELKRLMTWVEKAESKYAEALRKLSAQAEDLGAANLGDLVGFAKDMSEEVSKLRQGVADCMRSRSKSKGRSRGREEGTQEGNDKGKHKEKNKKKTRKMGSKGGGASGTDPDASKARSDGGERQDKGHVDDDSLERPMARV
ncbi:unnamed protein product [Ectocarpus sp. 4 AP-2014]